MVELNFHAKPGPEWLQGGAGRPLLGRPASWTSVISSWSRCNLRSLNADKARPAGLREAGRPPSGSSRPFVAPTLHLYDCDLPERWIGDLDTSLHGVVSLLILVQAFRSTRSNRHPILNSEAFERVTLPLDRRRGTMCGGARPASLGEAGRPGFLPKFAHFWYTCS